MSVELLSFNQQHYYYLYRKYSGLRLSLKKLAGRTLRL